MSNYWPEGMTWRDYCDACPTCDDSPANDTGDGDERCETCREDDSQNEAATEMLTDDDPRRDDAPLAKGSTMTSYFKAVPPSGVTRGTLDWNVPTGTVIRCDHNVADGGGVCPAREGDGISIAKTWQGAALAGFPTSRCCTITFDPADVLGEDDAKVRVRAATVGDWFDAVDLLRVGWGVGADLSGANLYGANLFGADLGPWERDSVSGRAKLAR